MKGGARGRSRKSLAKRFCSCIKAVRKTVRPRKSSLKGKAAKESAAIGICVGSVIRTRGRTLRKFSCGKKPMLETQSILK